MTWLIEGRQLLESLSISCAHFPVSFPAWSPRSPDCWPAISEQALGYAAGVKCGGV